MIERMLAGMHPTDEHRAQRARDAELEIEVPLEMPLLNASASRVLLRVLLKAARTQGAAQAHPDADAEALAWRAG